VDCVSRINTGAKYNDEVFQFSVGLNGVGAKAVNALSRRFEVRSYREGQFSSAAFEQGRLLEQERGAAPEEPDGTFISFEPDPAIFGAAAFLPDLVEQRLRMYTFLNAGLRIEFNGRGMLSRDGLLDLIRQEVQDEALYPPLRAHSPLLEISFSHTNRFEET
jgi:DNA gyrase/topoisomerase IV subunit B